MFVALTEQDAHDIFLYAAYGCLGLASFIAIVWALVAIFRGQR